MKRIKSRQRKLTTAAVKRPVDDNYEEENHVLDDNEGSTSYLPANLTSSAVSKSFSNTFQTLKLRKDDLVSEEERSDHAMTTTTSSNQKTTSNTSIHTSNNATIKVESVLGLIDDEFEINPDCDVDSSLDTSVLSEQSECTEEEHTIHALLPNSMNHLRSMSSTNTETEEEEEEEYDHDNEEGVLTPDTQGETSYKGILRTTNSNERKRSVTFADDNNLPITTQRTISVSPRKLVRRVRRGKGSENEIPSAFESMIMEESTSFIMGRVLVLLMDPPTKQYELTSVPYPLVSNENNHVGPTKLRDILKLVAGSASYEPLQLKTYQFFCRPDRGGPMDNELTIVDYGFAKDEVLIGVPEDYTAEQCQVFAKPILEDKRLVKLLRKLKKYEKRMDRKKRFEMGLQVNMKYRTAEKDRLENRSFEIKANWQQLMAGIMTVVCLAVLIGGFIGMAHEKVLTPDFHMNLLKDTGKVRSCQRWRLFGCRKSSTEKKNDFLKVQIEIFRNGIKDISNWRLEGDDLML